LTLLDLWENELSGPIPEQIFQDLTMLQHFDFDENWLSGKLSFAVQT
jgi:hypothetical protein